MLKTRTVALQQVGRVSCVAGRRRGQECPRYTVKGRWGSSSVVKDRGEGSSPTIFRVTKGEGALSRFQEFYFWIVFRKIGANGCGRVIDRRTSILGIRAHPRDTEARRRDDVGQRGVDVRR